jgi:hypothetical protein
MVKKFRERAHDWLAGALVLLVMFGTAMLTEAKSLSSVSPEQGQVKATNNDSDSKKKDSDKDKDKDSGKGSGKKGRGRSVRRKS